MALEKQPRRLFVTEPKEVSFSDNNGFYHRPCRACDTIRTA